ncbi:MAG: RNA polymerase sigma factor, partial [Pyrinomonadaceae bacterium]
CNQPVGQGVLIGDGQYFRGKTRMDYLTAWQNGIPIVRVEREEGHILESAELSDRHLVGSLLAGDDSAFELIFERYKRLIAATAGRFFRQPEQIEEMVQIAFAKAYFEMANFRGDHDLSFASWLGRITTNACLDTLRTQKRKPENLVCELSGDESDSLLEFGVHDGRNSENGHIQRDLAAKLLSRLGIEDRAILQMLHIEELSIAEIADVMNWSSSKVKLRAWRARNALRKIVKKFL